MKILIVSQYFWPESFKINDIALGLKEMGHEVSVLTALPNYPNGVLFEGYNSDSNDECWNGIKIYRSKIIPRGKGSFKLFLNYISFVWYAKLKLKKINEKFDSILVFEPSPITVGLPAISAAKKFNIPIFFWVQDLWPQSLTAAGGITNPLILGFFNKITKYIYRKSKKILVQSKGFESYIIKQGVSSDKIIFYPNTTENFYIKQEADQDIKQILPKGFIIMFAGNLGEAQSLETLLDAAKIVKEKNSVIKWVFLGDGRSKEKMKCIISNYNLMDTVFLLGSFPSNKMPVFFASSDVLIASLKSDPIFALTIPSKIQSYLACGKPILGSLDGEGAKIIEDSKCGFASKAEDSISLAENVLKLYNLSEIDRKRMGDNAIQYFNENFERKMLLEKLEKILKS